MSGLSMVAQSRPQSKADFCYTAPVTLERLGVCGTAGAQKLHEAEAAFATMAQRSDALRFSEADYHKLLRWAEGFAKRVHGIDAPWLSCTSDASAAASGAATAMQVDSAAASSTGDAIAMDVDDGAALPTQRAVRSRFFAGAAATASIEEPSPPVDDGTMLMPEGLRDFYAREAQLEARRAGKRKARV